MDPRPEVRVSLAASLRNVPPADTANLLMGLLGDPDLGVRTFAIQSVAAAHDQTVLARLRNLQTQDPAETIRGLAASRLRELGLTGP